MIQAIQAIRTWRDAADVKPSAILPAQAARRGLRRRRSRIWRGSAGWSSAPTAPASGAGVSATTIAIPGGVIEILPSAEVDLDAADRQARRQARRARGRDQARRGEAVQRRLRRQGAAGGGRGGARQAGGADGRSWRRCDPGGSRGSDCCRSSCSACGSGWTACAG